MTRIPLHRQPPVWLIACVVLASLSPVMLRAFGVELGPQLPMPQVATAQAHEPEPEPAQPIVEAAAHPLAASIAAPVMGSMPVAEPEVVIFEDADDDEDEADDAQPAAEASSDAVVRTSDREPESREAKPAAARPTELAEAKAACRRGNKDVARSLYRDLPVGDARRREIRRACRQEGVWIL